MKNYIYISLLLICIPINSQNNFVLKVPEVDSIFSAKLTGEFFYEKKQYIGDQYFNKDWTEGEILLSTGEMIYGKSLKYNGLFDELVWLNTFNFGKFKLDKSYINEFWFKNRKSPNNHFKQITLVDKGKDSVQNIFVEVIIEGQISLYVQHKISLQWPKYMVVDNIRQKYDVLEATPVYFIKPPSNSYLTLSKLRRKAFLRLFPEKQKEISKIIKDNHLNINIEYDFVKLIGLLNENKIF